MGSNPENFLLTDRFLSFFVFFLCVCVCVGVEHSGPLLEIEKIELF